MTDEWKRRGPRRGQMNADRIRDRESNPQTQRRRVTQKEQIALTYYRAAPSGLLDEEAADAAGLDVARSPHRRCGELRDDGLIAPTGERRRTKLGDEARVCAITGKGVDWVERWLREKQMLAEIRVSLVVDDPTSKPVEQVSLFDALPSNEDTARRFSL